VTQTSLPVTFEGVTVFRVGLPDDGVLAGGFHRRVAGDASAPNMFVRSPITESSALTAGPARALRTRPSSSSDTRVLHRKLALVHVEVAGRQIEQRLIGVGCGLPNVGPAYSRNPAETRRPGVRSVSPSQPP